MRTCENCYWRKPVKVNELLQTICLRYPPQVLSVNPGQFVTTFPIVNAKETFCGEWTRESKSND